MGKTKPWVAGLSGIDDIGPTGSRGDAVNYPTPEDEILAMQAAATFEEEEDPWADVAPCAAETSSAPSSPAAMPVSSSAEDAMCHPCAPDCAAEQPPSPTAAPAAMEIAPALRLRGAQNKVSALLSAKAKREDQIRAKQPCLKPKPGHDLNALRTLITDAQASLEDAELAMPAPPAAAPDDAVREPSPKRTRVTAMQRFGISNRKLSALHQRRSNLDKQSFADEDEEYCRRIRCNVADREIKKAEQEREQALAAASTVVPAPPPPQPAPSPPGPEGTLEDWLEEVLTDDPTFQSAIGQRVADAPQPMDPHRATESPWTLYSYGTLRDWLDLADLGGSPAWPDGMSYLEAKKEVDHRDTAGARTLSPMLKRRAVAPQPHVRTPVVAIADKPATSSEHAAPPDLQMNATSSNTDLQSVRPVAASSADVHNLPLPQASSKPSRAGEAKRQAARRAEKAAAAAQAAQPPTLARTFNAFSALMQSAPAPSPASNSAKPSYADIVRGSDSSEGGASSSHLPSQRQPTINLSDEQVDGQPAGQPMNWRLKRRAREAEFRPREIAQDEDDPSLTPAQRTMAKLRRRAAEREAQHASTHTHT